MTKYEKQKKEEDTEIPFANTILKNNPIPNQKYPKVYFLQSQSDQKLSHETRSDLKARIKTINLTET
jgi:hypothetical protein